MEGEGGLTNGNTELVFLRKLGFLIEMQRSQGLLGFEKSNCLIKLCRN